MNQDTHGIWVRCYDAMSEESEHEFISEFEILEMVEHGNTNRQVARHIGCTLSKKLDDYIYQLKTTHND